jgi:hypothetical protein
MAKGGQQVSMVIMHEASVTEAVFIFTCPRLLSDTLWKQKISVSTFAVIKLQAE